MNVSKPTRFAGALIIATFLFLLVFLFFQNRVQLGFALWETFRNEQIATLISNKDASLYFEIGNYYLKADHYDFAKARKYFILATEFDDAHAMAHYQLSRVYFIESSFYSAVREMDRVIELDPEFEEAYYMKGLIHGFRGEFEEAAAGFSKFNEMRPTNWAGYNDLAWVYFSAGEYELARDAALSGLANSPNNTWLNNSLGVALLNLEDTEGALEAFLKAEESANLLTPEDWGASYPGNDPRMYASGLEETRASIRYNTELIKSRQ